MLFAQKRILEHISDLGGVTELVNVAVSKTAVSLKRHREFESLRLRQIILSLFVNSVSPGNIVSSETKMKGCKNGWQ